MELSSQPEVEDEGVGLSGRPDGCGGNPKKVGILTFHRCINYGSYWQARQLANALRARGYDAVVLNHNSGAVNVAEWRCALEPTLPIPSSSMDRDEYACKTRKFLSEIERLPLSQPFDLDRPDEMEEFDVVIIGSDEVWNLSHPWYAARPLFFGEGLRAKRVVTYAASFGNYSCWEGIGEPWTGFLRQFDATSVRDENSWWMLKNALGTEAATVLDPCLQWPVTEQPLLERPYVLLYGHRFSADFAEAVRNWASKRSLRLISIGYRNDWADRQWLSAGPQAFARAMAGASAVATNFFHGCVFALANRKPFVGESSDYRSIKLSGLMELIGGQEHLITNGQIGRLLEEPPSAAIYERIAALRQSSDAYLTAALGDACPAAV